VDTVLSKIEKFGRSIEIRTEDAFDFLSSLENKSVHTIITDPPYGIGFSGVTSKTGWDKMSTIEYEDFLLKLFYLAKEKFDETGSMWLFCGRTQIPSVFKCIESSGLNNDLKNWMTYCRAKGRGSSHALKSQAEEIIHITKSKNYTFNPVEYERQVVVPYMKDGKPRGWMLDQITGQRVRWSGLGNVACFTSPFFKSKFEKQIHSTQKPVLLLCELILMSSNNGDTIIDPFSGSGSCAVASLLCDRDFMGTDTDKDMVDKSIEWLNRLDIDLAKEYISSRITNSYNNIFFEEK